MKSKGCKDVLAVMVQEMKDRQDIFGDIFYWKKWISFQEQNIIPRVSHGKQILLPKS